MIVLDAILSNPFRIIGLVGMVIIGVLGGTVVFSRYSTYQQHQRDGIEVDAYILSVIHNCDYPDDDASCRPWVDYEYYYAEDWYETEYEDLIPSSLRHAITSGMTTRVTVLSDDPTNSLLVGNHTDYLEHLQLAAFIFLICLFAFCMNFWKTGKPRNWFENICFYSRGMVVFAALAVILFGELHMLRSGIAYLFGGLFITMLLLPTGFGLFFTSQNLGSKMRDISKQELPMPAHIFRGVVELKNPGFMRLGEALLEISSLVFPGWYLRNDDGSIYAEVHGDKELNISFVTRYNELQFLETDYPTGTPLDTPGSRVQVNTESVADAYQTHLDAMPAHDTINPVLTMASAIHASILYHELQRPYRIRNILRQGASAIMIALGIIIVLLFWRFIGYNLSKATQYGTAYGSLAILILMHEIPAWMKQYGQSIWK